MLSATRSVSPSVSARCRASSLVSGGAGGAAAGGAAAAAARLAAVSCPCGDRVTHSAASSAVAKLPRCTFVPLHDTTAL